MKTSEFEVESASGTLTPSVPLPRGQACVNCRRRKMRCDGAHPVCGQCSRANRPGDCEYLDAHGYSKIMQLEQSIVRAEARVAELEKPRLPRAPVAIQDDLKLDADVLLTDPYKPSLLPLMKPSAASTSGPVIPFADPPWEVVTVLLDNFLSWGSEFGFFLNTERFRQSVLRPSDSLLRPSSFLLHTIYLWGIRLSNDPSLQIYESGAAERALQESGKALCALDLSNALHDLQAEVLLSNYFFTCGRLVEGQYHTASAASLAISLGLHKMRPFELPYMDGIERGERILAFWTVLITDKVVAIIVDSPANIACASTNGDGIEVSTPWPLEREEYEQGGIESFTPAGCTLGDFLTGSPSSSSGTSTMALLAKAILLWEAATLHSRAWKSSLTQDETHAFMAKYSLLQSQINDLKQILLQLRERQRPTPTMNRTFLLACAVANISSIQLNRCLASNNVQAAEKAAVAARSIIDMFAALDLRSIVYLNPIIGIVWMIACQVLAAKPSTGQSNSFQANLSSSFEQASQVVAALSAKSSFMTFCLNKGREAIKAYDV